MRIPGLFSRRAEADPLDRVVEAYRASHESGSTSLGRFWDDLGSSKTPSVLATLVKVDLWRRFERGERPKVLEYLAVFPVLADDRDRVVSLVYEEFCLLEESGEHPDSEFFCEAYGPWRDSLRSQLAYHRELSRAVGVEAAPVDFPDLGDRFEKYRLNSILGVGGVARVYLATEEDLGGRQVAIKVSASFGQEPSILAKLDHRNIVPILTVAESESGLLGICMPYRPGVTLEDLIRRIGRGKPPRKARAIVEAMRPRDSPRVPAEEERPGWEDFPADRTFAEAVAWIGLALAHALAYLHKQGVVHRDIKPANILLAYREGPQLLDFNLAKVPSNPEGASAAQRGGTLPYSAPEQLKAFLDQDAWGSVEEPSDLYSLGLVLRELLTGRPPELPTSQGSLAREIQSLLDRRLVAAEPIIEINPAVPRALDSIIDKCLAFRPEDRYADANDLATDLQLFLERKPLVFAPNTSTIELGVNWIARNWRALAATSFFLAVFTLLILVLPSYKPDTTEFEVAEAHLDSGRPGDLGRANAEFETLYRLRPDTARSTLGLALTRLKLDDPDSNRTNRLLKEVREKPDALNALEARLTKEPDSKVLLLNLGIVLSERGPYDRARAVLGRAIEVDKRPIMALIALAGLEQKLGRNREALGPLTRAIELGLDSGLDAKKIYQFRRSKLRLLVDLLDGMLDGRDGVDREEAGSFRRQLEGQLYSLEEDWGRIGVGGDDFEHSYTSCYFQGCLASIRGVEVVDDDPKKSGRFFDEADGFFKEAEAFESRVASQRDHWPIRAQESKLEGRRQRLAAPR